MGIVFPGDWWHQTYHYTPSISVCAQYCNCRNIGRVLGHILEWCGVPSDCATRLLASTVGHPAAQRIQEVLRTAVHWRRRTTAVKSISPSAGSMQGSSLVHTCAGHSSSAH